MRKLVTFLPVLLLICCFSTLKAQTVDEVINNYVTALGGKEKLYSIKSIYLEGVSVMQNGSELIMKTYKVQNKLMRREIEFGSMGNQTTIITDKEGWRSNPRNGGAFEPIPADRVKSQQSELDIAGPLVDYAAKGHSAVLIGKEDVEGTEAFKVKLTTKDSVEINYFIDPKTWYVIRESRKGGQMGGGGQGRPGAGGDGTVNMNFSNYQKTADGYVFPFSVSIGGQGAGLNYEKIEVNKPVDEKLYKPGN